MKLRTRGISGTRNQAESERERAHRVIARKAAAEGIVLLENNGNNMEEGKIRGRMVIDFRH